jgi:type 2 lantibiotic biosynthesis protein LanM
MKNENLWLRSIAARATPLWERESEPLALGDAVSVVDHNMAASRLGRWQTIMGSSDLLNHRLQSSNLSGEVIRIILGGQYATLPETPAWVATLTNVLSASSEFLNTNKLEDFNDRSYPSSRSFPFQEVLVGFIHYAREVLKSKAGSAIDVMSVSATTALERQLLAHLTFVANLPLGRKFYEFRFNRAPASVFETGWCQRPRSVDLYTEYVQEMHKCGLRDSFDEYPVLARLLCQSLDNWVNASVSLCQRFFHDFSDLSALFGWKIDRPEGAIEQLRSDLSDRHNSGQTVTECILRNGERVVYKPRTVAPERVFYQFIGWINDRRLLLDLKELRTLDRTNYGWVESVVAVSCSSESEVERFFSRAGMLLGILYVLAATDIHCENLIASGEHPVVVDLETLLSPDTSDPTGFSEDDNGEDGFTRKPSVLYTGLLPRWDTIGDPHQPDLSGLGANEIQNPGFGPLAWKSINSDQMSLSRVISPPRPTIHRARLRNKSLSVSDYLPAFLAGFREVYSCILENRNLLASQTGLLKALDNLELRILVRSTATYSRLQLHSLHPEFLKDGIDRTIELEWLARPLSGTPSPQEGRMMLYECERIAMEKLDVPHFGTSLWKRMNHRDDDDNLSLLSGERDSRVFLRRLESLNETDCSRQLAIIEKAVRHVSTRPT